MPEINVPDERGWTSVNFVLFHDLLLIVDVLHLITNEARVVVRKPNLIF